MTRHEIKEARHKLGLSQSGLADFLGYKSDRNIRRWEDGTLDVPNPVSILLRWLVDGKKPKLP